MRYYSKQNVFDAALDRIRWLFDEFPNVIVSYSGGKDSTVVFQLALIVAREKGRLPLKVMFIDQEAEWRATIDQVRAVMYHPDVQPFWYQIPMRLFNATSAEDHWLNCWAEEDRDRWIHPRDPVAITENAYGTDRFTKLFDAIINRDQPERTANIGGVRCEESPARFVGLTTAATYKWATWGKVLNKKRDQYTFYPIYDWSYLDVWKAIHSNSWGYNAIYDAQYSYGVKLMDMRVSNVHHETAVGALFYMQEVEADTWGKLVARIPGIHMAGKLGAADYFVADLPPMFATWAEYRDYLLEKLIDKPEWRASMAKGFARQDRDYGDEMGDRLWKMHVNSILTNDWEGIKVANLENNHKVRAIKERKAGKFYGGSFA